ncbi:MAG: CRISPR-associated helicase Cas3' [Clostridium sp.]|nr:CRISPR-associated helicase Cas3' [Clostridium sp.]
MEFKSHPDKLLRTHLSEVLENAKFFGEDAFNKATEIICLCHDFGKYTTYFQNYLETKEKNDDKSNHGFISAICGAYIGFNVIGEDNNLPLLIYESILHHHGSIESLEENLPKENKKISAEDGAFFRNKIKIAKFQIEDMKKNLEDIKKDYDSFNYGELIVSFVNDCNIEEILFKLKKQYVRRKKQIKRANEDGSKDYFKFLNMYSMLIGADKFSASNTPVIKRRDVSFNALDKSRKERIKKALNKDCKAEKNISKEENSRPSINKIRTEIYEDIQKEIEENYDKKILSITAPTGTGKTYSGFFAAEKLKELLGDNRRIIYALPFTSIINQNYDVIYNLISDSVENFDEVSSEYIIKHHSLTDKDYKSEKSDIDILKAELLIENWSSSIIVTTFVQLLETLISNKNRMLKKFSAFNHSIILLDEVQAIDLKYLGLVDFILRKAVEELDCRIITMTATKPILLSDGHELLSNYKKYFSYFNRTKINYNPNKVTIDEFIDDFIYEIKDESYLIICNTIGESLEIYKKLEDIPREVMYLSTNILPIHRKEKIKEIEDKLKLGEKLIVISTQVVEAGVDFDFDNVIRDIAPIDSIIQAAGRCNRHNKKACGEVNVVNICNSKERLYGDMVYGKMQIMISKEILNEYKEIEESQYLDLIEKYFLKAEENKNKDVSKKFIESINLLNFTGEDEYTISKFSLIEEKGNYVDVFFRINEEAEQVYLEFIDLIKDKDLENRRKRQLKIRAKFNDYTLSIPYKYASRINVNKEDIILSLPKEGCEEYYFDDIGFKREDGEEYMIF